MNNFWENRRIVVTGGQGFLGRYLLERLQSRGASTVMTPGIDEFDLRKLPDIQRMYNELNPDIVIHLAAVVG
ncbi:MAG: NAD-dependent epimerase/dehydratase family protein, partial [Candidatus Latescibacteria bacterium]|nr:NAD-dependent epimerase/dehydratase family protein [Candidatus Latescibacterota bacterium]